MEKRIVRKGYTIVDRNNEVPVGIHNLVDKVLLKTAFKKENGLFGDIETLGYDLDRVYLEANNTEFIIRMWNIYDTAKGCRITWTLFKDVEDEDGGSHGEEISYGESLVDMSE